MSRSSMRGVFLSTAVLFSIALVMIPQIAYAEGINVKSFALEDTTILEVANDSNEGISILRVWLGSGFNFESFKTEKDWVGEKTSYGVIIFTTSKPLNPGESVKFGIKTDKERPGINWKVVDKEDNQIDIGKILPRELPKVVQKGNPEQKQNPENKETSMSAESQFRIIPERPNVGSSIRVTGDNFGASQELDFYMDSKKMSSFRTDENGHFMTTMKIPDNQQADRVNFKVIDKKGEERKYSVIIGDAENRIPKSENVKLTIEGVPEVLHRGGSLESSGAGNPGSTITAEVTTPKGKVINTRTVKIDSNGNWKLESPIIIASDAALGKYSIDVTDGKENVLKHFTIEANKVIAISSSNSKFEPGETMMFNGTALPSKPIGFSIKNPRGEEIASEVIQTDSSGFVKFEFPTSQNIEEGTYTIIATQERETEFIFVGLGQAPIIPINIAFDKLNYKTGDEAVITFTGTGSDIVSLLITDPSNRLVGESISITLQPNGRGIHALDLTEYSSGVYTATVSKGSAKSSEFFTVGLLRGSGNIDIQTTKLEYLPGDSILILGNTGDPKKSKPNVLLTIALIDPNGKEVKTKETFSDKSGKIAEDTFRIPNDGISGTWTITARSGSNFDNEEIEVLATLTKGMQVTVEDGKVMSGYGETITIKVTGASQTVKIEIVDTDGKIIQTLSFPASAQGKIDQLWIIPPDTEPGTYTIKARDAFDSAETTYELR